MQAKMIAGMLAGLFICGITYAQQPTPATDPLSSSAAANSLCQFTKLDKNRDGYISREEATGHPKLIAAFDAIDTDKDGKISREEAKAFQAAHGSELREQFVTKFKAADKDGDGALTKEEAQAGGMSTIVKHFDKLDANKDGKVTPEEIKAAGMELKKRVACK